MEVGKKGQEHDERQRSKRFLKVQDVYWSLYSATKDKLAQNPKGKQFEFNESLIFSKLEFFCKRVQKLLDMFTTIHQFSAKGYYQPRPAWTSLWSLEGVLSPLPR